MKLQQVFKNRKPRECPDDLWNADEMTQYIGLGLETWPCTVEEYIATCRKLADDDGGSVEIIEAPGTILLDCGENPAGVTYIQSTDWSGETKLQAVWQ